LVRVVRRLLGERLRARVAERAVGVAAVAELEAAVHEAVLRRAGAAVEGDLHRAAVVRLAVGAELARVGRLRAARVAESSPGRST
jgi:hypothetical protein